MGNSGKLAILLIAFIVLILWDPTPLIGVSSNKKTLPPGKNVSIGGSEIISNQRTFTQEEQNEFFSGNKSITKNPTKTKSAPEPFSPLFDNYTEFASNPKTAKRRKHRQIEKLENAGQIDEEGLDYNDVTEMTLRRQIPSSLISYDPASQFQRDTANESGDEEDEEDSLLDFDTEQYIQTNPFQFSKLTVPHQKRSHAPLFTKFQYSDNMWTS